MPRNDNLQNELLTVSLRHFHAVQNIYTYLSSPWEHGSASNSALLETFTSVDYDILFGFIANLTPKNSIPIIDHALDNPSKIEVHYIFKIARKCWLDVRAFSLEQVANDYNSNITVSILGLLSLHHNGNVREAAVDKLSNCHLGFELPFLINRLNDWVDNARPALTKSFCW